MARTVDNPRLGQFVILDYTAIDWSRQVWMLFHYYRSTNDVDALKLAALLALWLANQDADLFRLVHDFYLQLRDSAPTEVFADVSLRAYEMQKFIVLHELGHVVQLRVGGAADASRGVAFEVEADDFAIDALLRGDPDGRPRALASTYLLLRMMYASTLAKLQIHGAPSPDHPGWAERGNHFLARFRDEMNVGLLDDLTAFGELTATTLMLDIYPTYKANQTSNPLG